MKNPDSNHRIADNFLIKNSQWYKNLGRRIKKILLPLVGICALIWFLVRVIPKPSRIYYPCVQAAAPFASSFIIYLIGIALSFSAYNKINALFENSRYRLALITMVFSIIAGSISVIQYAPVARAGEVVYRFIDPLGSNNPIGEAKGIFPGRVVWVYNPHATNENCTNENIADAYFQDSNTTQQVVDSMCSEGLRSLTGKEKLHEAWQAIFKYFNMNHGKGEIGYDSSETVFIKINAVSAWSGIGDNGDLMQLPDDSDTTPQTILSIVRQLVYNAGVPKQNIYIGDPMTGIWNHIYNKLAAEFPDIHYMDEEAKVDGRTLLVKDDQATVTYSDNGNVLTDRWGFDGTHYLYQSMSKADYLINIPVMKGHRWAGVTFFAKNHFGSNTSNTSWQLHKGLMDADDGNPVRTGYSKYRVLVDLMGSKYLGGKTLLYFMDALWSTSYEHQKPQKFYTAPFNDDWSSSLLFSLDPVAIESVCLDILQKEFSEEEIIDGTGGSGLDRFIFVQWDGVDDYLHQAASSDWWPDGLTYDPDTSGIPIPSLGVHEHWNNANEMLYSRNLSTGDGIELIKIFTSATALSEKSPQIPDKLRLNDNYPNPFNPITTITFDLPENSYTTLGVYNAKGQLVDILVNRQLTAGVHAYEWDANGLASGMYIYRLSTPLGSLAKKMLMVK